ncbi:MAG: hypothetical protein LLF86_01195 [Nitrospiraceae bacterium]|nr:hypothetical protein [Nitrospiraceae bacterium]
MITKVAVALFMIVFSFSSLINISLGVEIGPEEVVKKYYTVDLEGARVDGKSYKALVRPLIIWENEPGWDFVFITKKAYISSIKKDANKASIEVRYENAGFRNGEDVLSVDFIEVVSFTLIQKGGKWKIQAPLFYPHVSPVVLTRHYEQWLKKATDKDTIQKIKNQLNVLKGMK